MDSQTPMPRPWQFSLRMLLIVMTLVCACAAAFAWNPCLGIAAYLVGFSLFMLVWRARASYSIPVVTMAAAVSTSVAIALAAAIAFSVTCTAVQAPFVLPARAAGQEWHMRLFVIGLFVSMPLGTVVALFVYWFFWPKPPTGP